MKKLFAILALTTLSLSAFAGAGVAVQAEQENGKNGSPNTRSVSVAPFYVYDNGVKADVSIGASRDTGHDVNGNRNGFDASVEARGLKSIDVTNNLSVGLRVGVGEKFSGTNKAGKTVDFAYYTVEPVASYKVTDALSFNASYRYRNAFASKSYDYRTDTTKVGVAYKVTPQDEFGVKYFQKYGDTRSNGFDFIYTRGF